MRSALLLPLLLAACETDVYEDPDAKTPANVITGTLVVAGLTEPSDTIVLLFPGNNEPPPGQFGGPTQTGRPITFSTIPASEFTQGETDGTMSAPFYLSGLADNTYIVGALVDVDGNFHPLVDFMAGSTCGDWAGAHLADLTGKLARITVEGGTLTDNITVVVAAQKSWGRPAFKIKGESSPVIKRQLAIDDPDAVQTYTLQSVGIDTFTPFVDEDNNPIPYTVDGPLAIGSWDGSPVCESTFPMYPLDIDGTPGPDGHPDLPPNPSLLDIFPRVIIQYLGTPQEDGTFVREVPANEITWAGAGPIYPTNVLFGTWPTNKVTPSNELPVIWIPGARKFYICEECVEDKSRVTQETDCNEGDTYDPVMKQCQSIVTNPLDIPAGAWSVTVINHEGVTWTVPNSTAALDANLTATQGNYIIIQ